MGRRESLIGERRLKPVRLSLTKKTMENQKSLPQLVEIARSFSYKLNTGNYESRDFFCSQKIEVFESEAKEASERLFAFCQDEVMKSVHNYQLENLPIQKAKTSQVKTSNDKEKKDKLEFDQRIDELNTLNEEEAVNTELQEAAQGMKIYPVLIED